MPDGIDSFEVDGITYIATANEGDAREWEDYSGVTKTTIGGTKVETLDNDKWDGVDADSAGSESGEGNLVVDLSKQKITIRKNDTDTNDNFTDFETVSFKGLTADSEIVKTYLKKLGLG